VVLNLHSLRQVRDSRLSASGHSFNRKQELVLLRCKSRRAGRIFTKA
jgi:hypothetical protein